MKKCTVCKDIKTLDNFYKNQSRYDGWENHCKTCDNKKKQTQRKRTNFYKSIKHLARLAVSKAIKTSELVKQPCEKCGDINTQAHHCDYGKPLDVMWLCFEHHMEWHRHNKAIDPTKTNKQL